MERTPVSSSNLRAVGYDPASSTLEVEFNNGTTYQFADVPQDEYEALMSADSHGSYFNKNIRPRYPGVKL